MLEKGESKNYLDLELTLHAAAHDGCYSIELSATKADGLPVVHNGTAKFDIRQLLALSIDPLPYAQLLTRCLFDDPVVFSAFNEARAIAQTNQRILRVRLVLAPSAHTLHALHWEALMDPQGATQSYLFNGQTILFSRYLSSPDWTPVTLRPKETLAALAVIANPSNLKHFRMAAVNVEGELRRVESSLHGICLTSLASHGAASLNNLGEQLIRGHYDILYLVCHGALVDDKPWLFLEKTTGELDRVQGSDFVSLLQGLKYRPRLVVLASCQGAGSGENGRIETGARALVALAPRLAEIGIPAVLAMQGTISMDTVASFMPVFFEELLRDGQIDRAVAAARRTVSRRHDFWMPVLFTRLRGSIFPLQEITSSPQTTNFLPKHPPLFIGREGELAVLHRHFQTPGRVLGISGMPGTGKTTLALAYAHRARADFESVYWLPCHSGNLSSIASELTRLLGLSITGDLPQVLAELKAFCATKRSLLIFDNADSEDLADLIPNGAASVLVTTRLPGLRFLRNHPAVHLDLFTEQQCFNLFREVLGDVPVTSHESDCRQIFTRVERLPIAIDLAASSIKYDGYSISEVAAHLPSDVTTYISQIISKLPPDARDLLSAMSACAREGFRLSLAAELLNIDESTSLDRLRYLLQRSLVDELDRDTRHYRLHTLIRTASDGGRFTQQHGEAINRQFSNWEAEWQACEQDLPDFQLALTYGTQSNAGYLQFLASNGYKLCHRIGRMAEAFSICDQAICFAEQANDNNILYSWLGSQAVILRKWGRLNEAITLHKKEESLCIALGNRQGLSRSFGNQSLILSAWGRLEEALKLLKRQEGLCLKLRDKAGLQGCYGNQAAILQKIGRTDEALTLFRRMEELCLEIGDENGLSISYGNQAVILHMRGDLNWAFSLYEKQEGLCRKLGSKEGLQICYGKQAVILIARGSLDAALSLLEKQEAICLELGSQSGLAHSYWNQSLLAQARQDAVTEHAKLTAALAIFTDLKMPLEREAVAGALEKKAPFTTRRSNTDPAYEQLPSNAHPRYDPTWEQLTSAQPRPPDASE